VIRSHCRLSLGAIGITALALAPINSPKVMLNLTPSIRVGLYLTSSEPVTHGAIVMLSPRSSAHRVALVHAVTGAQRPMLKIVAAMVGDRVCRSGLMVSINGHNRVWARRTDHAGRPLPSWQGCRVLRLDELLVLGDHRNSFDGRYFGPIVRSDVITRVLPLWLF
jgi:conjugative transfer signal peptidase TraF